ncbi:uncharacterized protein LOC109534133 [Dendroctonus ponderosae]|uniref:U1-type domain-containing protein n=1 Tax=Dendroctonus ponderosae TaxID=77166 RepID=U4UFR1_DENPD|nr:uncharacterized protein LOC109534133 [Dendroctonus ponderosae]ERL88755.1 hypothetical protein D910_06137 [Dendroctonus ponderosae]KAH1014827.1 hypothetical protein HUJ05_012652 [Dendroctonus ponderosae]
MNFYDELENVPIKELARLHNEHLISDESSDACSEPENLPVFSIEQINSLVVHHLPTKTQLVSPETCRRVAQKLSELLLISYCNVCDKFCGTHYKTAKHHKNISHWLRAELMTSDPKVTAKVYCAPCNLALNLDTPDDHYSSETHKRCVELYCGCCQINVPTRKLMSKHIQSDMHAKKELMNPHSEYVPVLEEAINTAGLNAELVLRLSKLVGPNMCLICQDRSKKHRYSRHHVPNVLAWIRSNDTNHEFYPDNVALLFCAACNVVHLNNEIAFEHSRTRAHALNAKTYCVPCQRFLRNVTTHQQSKQHRQNIIDQRQSGAVNGSHAELPGESQSEKDKSAECSKIETEEATANIERILQMKVLEQLEEIANKFLANKTVSSRNALGLLKKVNEELASISKLKKPDCPSKQRAHPKVAQVRMELGRLRAIMAPRNRPWLSRNAALNYMSNLMAALVAKVTTCNPDYMFNIQSDWTRCSEQLLDGVVLTTEHTVWCNVLWALPLIEQFNAQLESLIESQRDASILEMLLTR